LPRGFTPSAPSILAAAACAARSTTGARSITVDAEPIECRDAHLDSEIAVRAAVDERRAFEREADLPRNGGGSFEDEINPPVAREGWPRDLAGHRYFDIRARRLERQDLRLHLACVRAVTNAQVDLDRTVLGDSIPGGAALDQANIGRDTPRAIVQTRYAWRNCHKIFDGGPPLFPGMPRAEIATKQAKYTLERAPSWAARFATQARGQAPGESHAPR
jgi:hypothetical protein